MEWKMVGDTNYLTPSGNMITNCPLHLSNALAYSLICPMPLLTLHDDVCSCVNMVAIA